MNIFLKYQYFSPFNDFFQKYEEQHTSDVEKTEGSCYVKMWTWRIQPFHDNRAAIIQPGEPNLFIIPLT